MTIKTDNIVGDFPLGCDDLRCEYESINPKKYQSPDQIGGNRVPSHPELQIH
ncbi:MAG: hypothetical protein WCI79_03005 [Candidatus Saccharibacteria bacterium]